MAGDPTTGDELPHIGLVGAGKVGLVLACALRRAGHRIAAVWDPSPGARNRASELFGRIQQPDAPAGVAVHARVVVLAVPDDVLAGVVRSLAAEPEPWPGVTVVHVSGRYGADVLRPLREAGATTAAMHPAMAFTGDIGSEVERIRGARFAVTGDDCGAEAARVIATRIGGRPVDIAEADRELYHAALAHGTNHLVTLVVQAARMLRAAGVDEPAAVLGPPLRAALDNALERGAAGATGPVVRGDVGTVAAHLHALGQAVPEALPTYREMSLAGVEIAWDAGRLPAERYARLRELLTASS